ncbi:hypothetical protein QR680_015690 [Steinernema hermaphroditum]|uniref:7TM GPCR serpentine receptor class x (Srx) domain-containing protein n=1 Tax=Steinernema hermaphroditum TaxID=289476 RepID=A0AA39H8N6_9BILA|nr:hypothetical protein QR680_015690 [Steinernema hermaphroditum]
MTIDNLFIGCIYIVLNGVVLPFYIALTTMFAIRSPYRNSMCFRIMFWLGVMECVQMVAGIQAGFLTLVDTANHNIFERIGGALNCMVLFARPLFLLVLAVNRLVTIIEFRIPFSIGDRFFKVLLITVHILALWHFCYRLTDIGKADYSLKYDLFRPPRAIPGTLNMAFRNISVGIDIVAVIATSVIDLCIFLFVVVARKAASLRATDVPILFQAVLTLGHVLVLGAEPASKSNSKSNSASDEIDANSPPKAKRAADEQNHSHEGHTRHGHHHTTAAPSA